MMGEKRPPGFDEDPTRWSRRIPIVALALTGLCLSVYLTLFQIDVLSGVWDPFFRSERVLQYLGIPDAALGALAYGTEIVLSLIGGRQKWRTMPWTVLAFGIVILSGALVSVLLILMQASLVGAWCTLCLVFGLHGHFVRHLRSRLRRAARGPALSGVGARLRRLGLAWALGYACGRA
jgi:hypothetical protein